MATQSSPNVPLALPKAPLYLEPSHLDRALWAVLDEVLGATRAEVAEVFLLDRRSQRMVLTGHRGPFAQAFHQITQFDLGQGFPGLVAAHREPIVTRELTRESRYLRTKVKDLGFQSYACVPLETPKGILGSLNIASRAPSLDLTSSLDVLSWLSRPLSIALQESLLEARELVTRYQADPLADIATNLEAMVRDILQRMMEVSGAAAGAVTLWNVASGGFDPPVTMGEHPDGLCPAMLADGERVCPALAGRIAVVNPPEAGREWAPPCRSLPGRTHGAICLPLMAAGKPIGIITLAYQRPGSPASARPLAILSAMTEKAELLVHNAQSYLQMEQRALAAERARLASFLGPTRRVGIAPPTDGRFAQAVDSETAAVEQSAPLPLDIRCLGPFRVYKDGRLLPASAFKRRKALTALKILAAARGKPVPKDVLMEHLWPDTDPERANDSLFVVMHSLRQTLEPGKPGPEHSFILNEGESYVLNPQSAYRLDVDEFLREVRNGRATESRGEREPALALYQAAARLYGGDFLEDEPYSDWCWAERERLREVYLDLLVKIARLLVAQGQGETAIPYYRRALAVDPLREEVARAFMLCLWRAGRRNEALRQYDRCRQTIERELGVAPLPETQALYQRILEDSPRPTRPSPR